MKEASQMARSLPQVSADNVQAEYCSTQTLNVSQRHVVSPCNPLATVLEQGLQKIECSAHMRHGLWLAFLNVCFGPAAAHEVFPVSKELLVIQKRHASGQQLSSSVEDAGIDGELVKQGSNTSALRGGKGRIRGRSKALLEPFNDKPSIAVDISSDGQERYAAIFDA